MITFEHCSFAIVSALALASAACSDGADSGAKQSSDPTASVRAFAEKYKAGPDVAEADGYVLTGECTASPEGGMGFHYLNGSKLAAPPQIDDPPILLYVPSADGVLLGGVEYLQPIIQDGAPYMGSADEPPRSDSVGQPPVLFEGHPFNGPMAGHEEGMPWHYDQHLWLFVENPKGMFTGWNPNVSCPSG